MYLIQLFLPVFDNGGKKIAKLHWKSLESELADRFGGVTTYSRAPANGTWKRNGHRKEHDELIVFEVMSARVDERWWKAKRRQLEEIFRQHSILVRIQKTRVL